MTGPGTRGVVTADPVAVRREGASIRTPPAERMAEDSIVEITNRGTPAAHVEAMQSLGGRDMRFTRTRFITPGPYDNGVAGQTASVNVGSANTLFDSCEFGNKSAAYYMVYFSGSGNSMRNCRIASGLAGHFYKDASTVAPAVAGTTDFDTGAPVSFP